MNFELITPKTGAHSIYSNHKIADFLFVHLDSYGDPKEHIFSCIEYALSEEKGRGGLVLLAIIDEEIVGVVVVNETGMSGYIPENILVYIAVNAAHRGKGIGKQLLEYVKKVSKGDIALHVEANNPAKGLYEKLGFTNPYLEMRWKR